MELAKPRSLNVVKLCRFRPRPVFRHGKRGASFEFGRETSVDRQPCSWRLMARRAGNDLVGQLRDRSLPLAVQAIYARQETLRKWHRIAANARHFKNYSCEGLSRNTFLITDKAVSCPIRHGHRA